MKRRKVIVLSVLVVLAVLAFGMTIFPTKPLQARFVGYVPKASNGISTYYAVVRITNPSARTFHFAWSTNYSLDTSTLNMRDGLLVAPRAEQDFYFELRSSNPLIPPNLDLLYYDARMSFWAKQDAFLLRTLGLNLYRVRKLTLEMPPSPSQSITNGGNPKG